MQSGHWQQIGLELSSEGRGAFQGHSSLEGLLIAAVQVVVATVQISSKQSYLTVCQHRSACTVYHNLGAINAQPLLVTMLNTQCGRHITCLMCKAQCQGCNSGANTALDNTVLHDRANCTSPNIPRHVLLFNGCLSRQPTANYMQLAASCNSSIERMGSCCSSQT